MSRATFGISMDPRFGSHEEEEQLPMRIAGYAIFLSVLATCFLASFLSSFKALLFTVAGLSIFSLPGVFIGLALFGRRAYCPESLIFGTALGIGLSSTAAVAVGYITGWFIAPILTAIAVLSALCALVAKACWRHPLLPPPRRWESWEYLLLACITLLLTGFVGLPFMNVGKLTAHGYAYTWLFGWDFLVHGEYASSMTTGFPPNALALAGEHLRMYLVAYAPPAFIYSLSQKTIPLHGIMQLTALPMSMLLYGSLYSFLRTLFARKWVLISTVFVLLFGYSYYWLVSFAKVISLNESQPAALQRIGHELLQFGNISHLLNRVVLVEPQGVLTLCFLLFLLSALELTRYEICSYALAACFGITLGASFGIDALSGLVTMLWFGAFTLARLFADGHSFVKRFSLLATAVVSCGVVCLGFFWLGMYHFSSGHELQLNFYSGLLKLGPAYFLLNLGPLLLLGIWGFIVQWKSDRSTISTPLIILAAAVLFQVAFVKVPFIPRVRMADRVLPLVLLAGVGYLFRDLYKHLAARRLSLAWGFVLLAIPTFFTDIYFARNISDANETRYVNVADQKACNWIRHNLSGTAVIQGEPEYVNHFVSRTPRQEMSISLIASFAERPQVLGWNYHASELVPNGEKIVEQRAQDLKEMLSSKNKTTLLRVVQKYGIDYLYVGPYEQAMHPALLTTIGRMPENFERVYLAEGVHIFRILRQRHEGDFASSLGPTPTPQLATRQ